MSSLHFTSATFPIFPAESEFITTSGCSHEKVEVMSNTTQIHNASSPLEEQGRRPYIPLDERPYFEHQSTNAGIALPAYDLDDFLEAFTANPFEADTPGLVHSESIACTDYTTSDSRSSPVQNEVSKDEMQNLAGPTGGACVASCPCSQIHQELKEIRTILAQIQSGLPRKHSSGDSSGLSSGIKRGNQSALRRLTKRKRRQRNVNFRVVRAWLRVDEEKQTREYLRMRKYGDRRHCWATDINGISEEVDGEYLLSFSSELALEVRANGDWLPLEVRWDEKSQQFKSVEGIDGNTLCITDAEMIAAMTEGTSSYTAHVSWR